MKNSYLTWSLRNVGLAFSLFVFLTPGLKAETAPADNSVNKKHFAIYMGGFYPRVNSNIQLDADIQGGIGDSISLEDTLTVMS